MSIKILKTKTYILSFLLILVIYITLYAYINNTIFGTSQFPYYSQLLDAILKGKLNITPLSTIDLSIFKGKWYLNWGPGALAYVLVFKVFSLAQYDKLYTLILGLLNVAVFIYLLRELKKYFKINLSRFSTVYLVLNFALASPNLYLSMSGRIWFTEQIAAILSILISLFALFRFLNKEKIRFFIISAVFFNLAWLTRAPLVFHVAIFIAAFIHLRKEKIIIKVLPTFIIIGILFTALFFAYNYFRFQNIFETGLKYHLGNPRYEIFLDKGEIFSLQFVQFNFIHYFLTFPSFILKSPYLILNLEGNSIFSFYPILLLILIWSRGIFTKFKNNILLLSFLITILLEMFLLLLYFATGWTQVGMRYFFDLVPLSFLLSAFILDKVPKSIRIVVLIFGFLVNFLGALIFFNKIP